MFGVGDEVLADAFEGFVPEVEVDGFLFRCLEVLFDEVFYEWSAKRMLEKDIYIP